MKRWIGVGLLILIGVVGIIIGFVTNSLFKDSLMQSPQSSSNNNIEFVEQTDYRTQQLINSAKDLVPISEPTIVKWKDVSGSHAISSTLFKAVNSDGEILGTVEGVCSTSCTGGNTCEMKKACVPGKDEDGNFICTGGACTGAIVCYKTCSAVPRFHLIQYDSPI